MWQYCFDSSEMAEITCVDVPTGKNDPVTIVVDKSAADGEGPLRVEARNDEDNVFDVACQGEEDRKITFLFTPPTPAVYQVLVTWGDDNVKHSPLSLNLNRPNSKAVTISEAPSGNLKAGGNIRISFDASQAGRGTLTSTCKTDNEQDIEVTVTRKEFSSVFVVEFRPPHEDLYILQVKWDGKSVKGSPFKLDMNPILSSKVIASNLKEPKEPGDTIELDVCTKGAGNANLTATCKGDKVGDIPVEIKPKSGSDFHLTATTDAQPDNYTLQVYFNNHKISNPTHTCCTHPPKPEGLGADGVKHLSTKDDDCPVILTFDACEAGEGNFRARVHGGESGPVESTCELLAGTNQQYHVSFKPPCADSYFVDAYWNDCPLPGSPFNVLILRPAKLEFGEPRFVELEIPVELPVDASEAGPGKLTASCKGETSGEMEVFIEDDPVAAGNRKYVISFRPSEYDRYTLSVLFEGDEVSKSPFVINIEEPEPQKSPVVLSAVDIPTFPVTKPYKINFTDKTDQRTIQAFGIHEETGDTTDLTIEKRRNGKAKLIYNAKQIGIHSLHVLVDEKEISSSPFRVLFVKADPNACKLLDIPDITYVGEETSFKLDARKSGSGDLKVLVRVPLGGRETTFSHKNHNNGFYTIFFTPKVVGIHHFDISWADKPIFESPMKIEAQQRDTTLDVAKEAAAKVYVHMEDYGVFETALSATRPAYICISTGHAGKGKLSLKAVGPSEAKISVYDRENGVYTAEIQPVVAGMYSLSIFWNDIHIKDSPFKLDFTKDKSYLINRLDLDSVHFLIDVPYTFHIHCPREEKCELTMACTPTTAAHISCKPLEDSSNSFLCEIIPKEGGNHKIAVKYNSKEVHNSPHNVQFEENREAKDQAEDDHLLPLDVSIDMGVSIAGEDIVKPLTDLSPSKVRAFGPGLSEGLVGQEGHFTIETANAGEGKIDVEVYGPKGAYKINIRRHPDNNRTLLARYDPKVVGEYKIRVLWDGEHISASPYSVNISEQVVMGKEETTVTSKDTEIEPSNVLEVEIEQLEIDEQAEVNEECEKTDLSKEVDL